MAAWASLVLVILNLGIVAGTLQNVAKGKPTSMSKRYTRGYQPAWKAVDGVTIAHGFEYLAVTELYESTAWWKVDLYREVMSPQVIIYFRTDYSYRRNGVQLYTSTANSSDPKEGDLCHTVTGRPDGTDIPGVLNVTCPGTWRYLTVYTETDNDGAGAVLEFAEVQVWTCEIGLYGAGCTWSCWIRRCKPTSTTCNPATGVCLDGCINGYLGFNCLLRCPINLYGENCTKHCRDRHCKIRYMQCNPETGICRSGCASGFMGVDCLQACVTGMYGEGCRMNCSSRRCKTTSHTCNHETGMCSDGCVSGFMGDDCSQKCPNGTYGINCNLTCGHCADNNTCHHVTGTCSEGCQEGWQLDLCQTSCDNGKFGVNCETHCGHCNGTCDAVDGRCLWGCAEGYIGSHCSLKLSD